MKRHSNLQRTPTVRIIPPSARDKPPEKPLTLIEKLGLLLSLNRLIHGSGTTKDKQTMNEIITKFVAPVIRHGLTAAGGWLVAIGLPGPTESTITDLTTIATGAVIFGVGLLWSIIEKKFRGDKPAAK